MREKPVIVSSQQLGLSLSLELLTELQNDKPVIHLLWATSEEQDEFGCICAEFSGQFATPTQRRSWLLLKALETNTFEDALEVARMAEAFLLGAATDAKR